MPPSGDRHHQGQSSRDGNHRLHALCPYFAMFPPSFARSNILAHTKPGELVLDPFSGRGTTLLEGLLHGRAALASDINPVAYCVSAAKGDVPALGEIWDELDLLECRYHRSAIGSLEGERRALPTFFRRAFEGETLRQLLFLRRHLRWREDRVHRFITAIALGHLHGESERSSFYFSNQMPHSISTKPEYSLRYWRENGLWAPPRDVFDLLADRASFRLEEGAPRARGRTALCDVRQAPARFRSFLGQVQLCTTSPPYLDTTKFEEDQWLRLWFLGGPPQPTYKRISQDDRYAWSKPYWRFLEQAWRAIAPLLQRKAVLACRLGARGYGVAAIRDGLLATLRAVWSSVELVTKPTVTLLRNRQTAVLHPLSVGCRFEVDVTVCVGRVRPA